MAFGLHLARQLMIASQENGFRGHLIALSRYDLGFTPPMLSEVAASIGFDLGADADWLRSQSTPDAALPSVAFYKTLGFDKVTEIEYFEQGPNLYRFDMNQAATPPDLIGAADAIFDLGTSEHIFHVPHVLSHLGRMLKVGGIVVHHTPGNNHFNHGFYQFSPTFYFDYYRANEYTVSKCLVNTFDHWNSMLQAFAPLSTDEGWKPYYKMDPNGHSLILFVARKEPHSSVGRIPMQRYYVETATAPPLAD
jgi:SAM-dependent methyltransferase